MPMDYAIAAPQFNVAPTQVGGPVNMLTDVLKLKGLQQDQQLNQLKFQEYQRARGEAALKSAEEKANKQAFINAMRNASVGATGPQLPDMEAAANSLIGQGKLAPALTALGASEAFTKNLKTKSDLAKVDTENLDKQLSTFRTFAAGVNSPEAASIYAKAMYQHPVIGPLMKQTGYDEDAAAAKAMQDYAVDPQRWMASHVGLTGQQVVDSLKQTTANTDLGGQMLQQQRDAFGRPIPGGETRLEKMPVPRATAPEQTSNVVAPPINNLAPVPTTAAANAQVRNPVQLAMFGGVGASPLLQMARPTPAARKRTAAEAEPEVATEDNEPPLPKLTPTQELKLRDQVAKDYEKATAGIAGATGVLDATKKVREAKGLSGATGVQSYFPSMPDSPAAIAENRIANLRGKVTLMGKSVAAATGAIGSIANQEWKILRDMVAAIEPGKGQKALLEQISEIEDQARGAEARIRDAYEKHHEQNVRRFPTYKDLPERKTFVEPEEQKNPSRRGTLSAPPQSTLPAGVTSSGW